jgi:hypothetical protein
MEQKDKLYCISSDASATSAIERNVILAEAFGADVDFISERLEKHEKFFARCFFASESSANISTMAKPPFTNCTLSWDDRTHR